MAAPLILGSVNLPHFIFVHASGLVGLGLYFIFRRPTVTLTSTPSSSSSGFVTPDKRTREVSSMLGITTIGLGLAYFTTSYMPIEKNQFLYASVPVRLILATTAGLKVILERMIGEKMSVDGEREMLGVMLYDGLGALILGWWLGEGGFGGRAPVY